MNAMGHKSLKGIKFFIELKLSQPRFMRYGCQVLLYMISLFEILFHGSSVQGYFKVK